MATNKRQQAYSKLKLLYEKKGYVVFDDILDIAEQFKLAINDVDWVSNTLATNGVIIYDDEPEEFDSETDQYNDYSHVDYERIYERILYLDPSLSTFIDEIKQIKPPQLKEMKSLQYQALEGNQFAKQRIIEMHLRHAVRIGLQRAETYDLEIADIIQEACIGLLLATDKYNPDEHGAFASYASMWALQNMTRVQPTQRGQIYYPAHQKEKYYAVYSLLKENEIFETGIEYTKEMAIDLIMDRIGCDEEQAQEVLIMSTPLESYEELFYERREDIALLNFNPVEAYVELKDLHLQLSDILDSLTERERQILESRYGLIDGDERTLEEVGREFNLTRERIRQIESKALKKCAHPTRRKRIIDYIE